MKLTRKLVLAKAKASDLESFAYILSVQISIFSQIPNIKVLTLSVNSISSLAPLAGCLSLCELYLRRNMIPSLSELSHLRPLKHLRVLWLAENPCCGADYGQYRLTVLRCLPHLQKLDNQGEHAASLPHPPVGTEAFKRLEELGMKPLSRDKFPSLSSPSTREMKSSMKKTHTLDAILLLLKDLDEEELHIVHTATQNRLQSYTLDSEMLKDSLQTQKTVDIQH
uniref:Cilia and flagella associated protein 410 n=1 Tax=Mastacembelus armatus TaxID=205130 RepID=A0A3Q3MSF7_9TELE